MMRETLVVSTARTPIRTAWEGAFVDVDVLELHPITATEACTVLAPVSELRHRGEGLGVAAMGTGDVTSTAVVPDVAAPR